MICKYVRITSWWMWSLRNHWINSKISMINGSQCVCVVWIEYINCLIWGFGRSGFMQKLPGKNIVYLQLTVFPWLLHVYRKDAIEPTQSTAECRNNHARWVRDIDFSPTPKTSFVNWLWLGITAFRVEDDECTVKISFGNSYKLYQIRNTARP